MKLIKWAKKNGAAKVSIGGVEIEFITLAPESRPSYQIPQMGDIVSPETRMKVDAFMGKMPQESSDSTHKALAAIRSRLEDPEAFARQTDAWANQTRLPR